ncbi:MAG: septum formation inhibitor Maf [Gammaproteobacteria bacterium]|mgnify:FL=1|jgi:MAF protein|nr:septum formation inhibitor Maf [Gammaproteobacteria bacterium]MBT6044320.1 septum formation inhibitor Maf [Gammaproteobacteria bacterium]
MNLVLASSSPTRIKILEQLRLPFTTCTPGIDESPLSDESLADYVARLSAEKARAVSAKFPDSLIIGSDQACSLHGLILGKPANTEAAFKHLKMCSGNWVQFQTGLTLINSTNGEEHTTVESYRVKFRSLSDEEIKAYLSLDNPLGCAGCFKVEEAGITLFEALDGSDYNTLLGLPLIALVSLLKKEGLNPLLAARD